MPLVEMAKEFAELTKKKRDLERQLAEVENSLATVERTLLLGFESSPGVMKLTVDGMTVSPRRQVFASPIVSREHAAQILVAAGKGEFVQPNYNANSVSALLRELEKDGKLEESGLLEGFKLIEKFSIAARSAGGKNE